jgi:hypothetical protein
LAVKVPREEDIGIDFYCNLAKPVGKKITYFAPYNVQVKSAGASIAYGGKTKKGGWRKHQVEWFRSQDTPFFIALIDKSESSMKLFSTVTRWFLRYDPRIPYEVVLNPNGLNKDGHLGDGTKTTLREVSRPDGLEAFRWELPLGPPILRLTLERAENPAFMHKARGVLEWHIREDLRNASAFSIGLHHIYWPLIFKTDEIPEQRGIALAWTPGTGPRTHTQLQTMTQLVAELLLAYEHGNEGNKVRKFSDILDLLSDDPDLGFQRHLAVNVFKKQCAWDEIIRRYNGEATKEGYVLETIKTPFVVTVRLVHRRGPRGPNSDQHYIYVASIAQPKDADAFTVGWFRATEDHPFAFRKYASEEELFSALDDAVAKRSAEAESWGTPAASERQ